jgi:hypothetical protein
VDQGEARDGDKDGLCAKRLGEPKRGQALARAARHEHEAAISLAADEMLFGGGDRPQLVPLRPPLLRSCLDLARNGRADERPIGILPPVKADLAQIAIEVVLADALGGRVHDHLQTDVAAGVRRQRSEGAQQAATEALVVGREEFRLNRPITAMLLARDQVDALVELRQIDRLPNVGRHVTLQPNVGERRAVFRLRLQVELHEPLEVAAFLVI